MKFDYVSSSITKFRSNTGDLSNFTPCLRLVLAVGVLYEEEDGQGWNGDGDVTGTTDVSLTRERISSVGLGEGELISCCLLMLLWTFAEEEDS